MNEIVTVVSKALANSPTGVTFFGIKNYRNSQGEISDYTINIGTSFEKAKLKDFEYVSNLDVSTLVTETISIELLEKAKQALIDALLKPNKAQSDAQKNAYTHINHAIKVHNETDVIYVFGTKVRKATVSKGKYKTVNSAPLTIAKNIIRKGFKSTNYRQFKVEPQETNTVAFSGASETILVEMV